MAAMRVQTPKTEPLLPTRVLKRDGSQRPTVGQVLQECSQDVTLK